MNDRMLELQNAMDAFNELNEHLSENDKKEALFQWFNRLNLTDEALKSSSKPIGKTREPSPAVPHLARKGKRPDHRGCFSQKIEAVIEARAKCLGVRPEGVVGALLSAMSAALPCYYTMRIGDEWTENPTIWVVISGESSTKKTPTMKSFMKFFKEKQQELVKEHENEMSQYSKRMLIYKTFVKNFDAKKTAIEQIPDEPQLPKQKFCIINEVTIEEAFEQCAIQPRGIYYFRDEFDSWISQIQKKESSNQVGSWLQAYNGEPFAKGTKTAGSTICSRFRVVLFGGVQPSKLKKILNEDDVDGLGPRFIIIEHDVEGKATLKLDKTHNEYINGLLSNLHSFSECEIRPNSDVEQMILEIANEYEEEARKIPSGNWRSFMGKRSGLLARVLMILHAIDASEANKNVVEFKISTECVNRAKRFVDNFAVPAVMNAYLYAGVNIPDEDGVNFSPRELRVVLYLREQYKKGNKTITIRGLKRGSRIFLEMANEKRDAAMLEKLLLSGLVTQTKGDRCDSLVLAISEFILEVGQ